MWRGRDVLSILEFTRAELEELFAEADAMREAVERGRALKVLEGYVLATAFFEPSTRTKLSFQAAMLRLGGAYIDLPPEGASSRAKGENLADTIRMLDSYADVIVVRHRLEGAAKYAAQVAGHPVINGGDGTRDHPTQVMIDLYTVRRALGSVDGLNVGVLGDLRYGRAARSFILGFTLFRPSAMYLISPPSLRCREDVKERLEASGIKYYETENLEEVVGELDVLYVTRIQRERFPDPMEYERVRGSYVVTRESLRNARERLVVLHPLPRVDELAFDVDGMGQAWYFRQAANGVPVRMALLKKVVVG